MPPLAVDLTPASILYFVLVCYSIILHEIAHGYAALKFGDETAKHHDRLTLNPVPHVDPIGTILFPAVQLIFAGRVYLGWAKPVPVNTHNLEPRTAGEIVVAVAGVTVNFCIAVALAIVIGFFPLRSWENPLVEVFRDVMVANIGLMLFNLLPIPPLDGSHVLAKMLPEHLRPAYQQIGFYGTIILLFLSTRGVFGKILGPPLQAIWLFLFEHVTLRVHGLVHG